MAHTKPKTQSTEEVRTFSHNADWLTNELARSLNTIDSQLKGKLFTIVEALGFSNPQAKSLKDIISQTVEGVLSGEGEGMGWLIYEIKAWGIEKDKTIDHSPESEIPSLARETRDIGLKYYRHWDANIPNK